VEHVYPLVRSQKQLDRVLDEIEEAPGIVLFTLLEKDLVGRLEAKCQEINIPSLSIIGPVMQLFQAYLGAPTTGRVGAQHTLNAEYFKRIDALNYTMMHDDGQHVEGLEEADVVLVGVSRTSKTPTSIYLANRGECSAGAGHCDSSSTGGTQKAARGQPARDARAPYSGEAEPPVEHGRSRQRHLHRSAGGHG
jgi:regulator of PEP synthase PpsR (kinase-PPPase family)